MPHQGVLTEALIDTSKQPSGNKGRYRRSDVFEKIDDDFLNGARVDFVDQQNPDLQARWNPHFAWWQGRLKFNGFTHFPSGTIQRWWG